MYDFRWSLVIVVGLAVAGCAGKRQAPLPSEADEEYRARILSLLEGEEKGKADTSSQVVGGQREAGGMTTLPSGTGEQAPSTAVRQRQEAGASVTESLYTTAQARYQELQAKLRARQATLDSLKRVMAAADQEIKRLDQQVKEAQTAPVVSAGQLSGGANYQERYQNALRLAQQQNFHRAIAEFERLIAENPRHPLADNSQYWIGQCLYDLGRFNEAIAEFLKVFSFSETDKYDDAHLMICKSYVALGQGDAARVELRSFLLHYPTSEYRRTATALLQALSQ